MEDELIIEMLLRMDWNKSMISNNQLGIRYCSHNARQWIQYRFAHNQEIIRSLEFQLQHIRESQ